METRAKRRRALRARFLDLPEEVFAMVLSFHPDRADPSDPIVCALNRLAGRYANERTTTTTETVHIVELSRQFVHELKTITLQNYQLHSDDQPAILVFKRTFWPKIDTPIKTVAEFEAELIGMTPEIGTELHWYQYGKLHRDGGLPAFMSAEHIEDNHYLALKWFLRGIRAPKELKCWYDSSGGTVFDGTLYHNLSDRPDLQAVIDHAKAEIQRFGIQQ